MSILVTGGAGYIGSHVVLALQARGEEVVVIDNFSTSKEESVPLGAPFLRCSLSQTARLRAFIRKRKVRSVIHLAGLIKVEESVRDPLLYYKNNVDGTRSLLEAGAGYVEEFIFSSSAAVYGTPAFNPVPEYAPTEPLSPYGETKLVCEHLIDDAARAQGVLRFVSLRYFNVAGADPEGRAGYVLEKRPSHLIRSALAAADGRRSRFEVFGTDYPTNDGTAVRDFIHVADLAELHVEALEHLRSGGNSEVLNCGYGTGISVLGVLDAAKRVTGNPFKVVDGPRRPGDVAVCVADVNRLRTILPRWKPKYDSIELMLEHQWAWERSRR